MALLFPKLSLNYINALQILEEKKTNFHYVN